MTDDPQNQGAQGYSGQSGLTDENSPYNELVFNIWQQLGLARTHVPVIVTAVANVGLLAPVGRVDVMPLLNQMDGAGNGFPTGIVNDVPYIRIQGGRNAVIIDPAVGDKGLLLVCDRDISALKGSGGEQSNPGSKRRFNLADGIFIGCMIADTPDQYVRFSAAGITLSDRNGNSIEMKAGSIAITAAVLTVNGAIIGGFGTADQVGLQTHSHTANNTPPTPGL